MRVNRILEVTTNIGCGLLCSYCPQATVIAAYRKRQAHVTRGERCVSLETLLHYLCTVPSEVDVHFSGFSEPWHAPECGEMIRAVSAQGHRIAVFTTADRLPLSDIPLLEGIPFKRFVVHLPDASGEMRKEPNDNYIEVVLALSKSAVQGLEFLTLGIPHPSLTAALGRTPVTRRVHDRAGNVSISSSTVGVAFSVEEIRTRTSNTSLICRSDRMFSNVLLPNGDVQFCAMDYGLSHRVGNLGTQSYRQIVEGPAFSQVFELLRKPNSDFLCRTCEYAVPGQYKVASA